MMYLDIILSRPDAEIEVLPHANHKWMGIKDLMKKPKLSLWDMWKLKMQLEEGYAKLIQEDISEEIKLNEEAALKQEEDSKE